MSMIINRVNPMIKVPDFINGQLSFGWGVGYDFVRLGLKKNSNETSSSIKLD